MELGRENGLSCWLAGGGGLGVMWGFGYWQGQDKDLLCVKRCNFCHAERNLSPLFPNIFVAFALFLVKRLCITVIMRLQVIVRKRTVMGAAKRM